LVGKGGILDSNGGGGRGRVGVEEGALEVLFTCILTSKYMQKNKSDSTRTTSMKQKSYLQTG
jgi:hypothetical protein